MIYELRYHQKRELETLDKDSDRYKELKEIESKLEELEEIRNNITNSTIRLGFVISCCTLDKLYEWRDSFNTIDVDFDEIESFENILDEDGLNEYLETILNDYGFREVLRATNDLKFIDDDYFFLESDGTLQNIKTQDLKDICDDLAEYLRDH